MSQPSESTSYRIGATLRQITTRSATNIAACVTTAAKLFNGTRVSPSILADKISRLVFEDSPAAAPVTVQPQFNDRLIILTDGHHNVGPKRRVRAQADQLKHGWPT